MDDFNHVADRETVHGFDLGHAVFVTTHRAHKVAALQHGGAGFVVLVVVGGAALQQATGVAPVGQPFQLGDQRGVEGAAGHSIVNGAAVGLRGAGHVVQALGAAFNLERIHTNLGQALHVLNGAQVLGVHDVSAVLIFHDGHHLAGAALFFQQVDGVGLGVALLVAAGAGELVVQVVLGVFKVEALFHGLTQRFARVGVDIGAVGLVLPAAGVGAGALVGIAAVEVA